MRRRIHHLLSGLALLAITFAATAHAAGAWQTHIRMTNCTQMLALGDSVWVGTGGAGLLHHVVGTPGFTQVTREPGALAGNVITALAVDRSGTLWVGVSGKGISRLHRSGAWDLINPYDGLPSDTVTALFASGDSMWIGTTQGIALWDGRQVAGTVPGYGAVSPFASNHVSGVVQLGDSLFVATWNGIYLGRISQSLRDSDWIHADSSLATKRVEDFATDGTALFAISSLFAYRLQPGDAEWHRPALGSAARHLRGSFGHVLMSTNDSLCVWATDHWRKLGGARATDITGNGGLEFTTNALGKAWASDGTTVLEQGPDSLSIVHETPGPGGNDVHHVVSDGLRAWTSQFASGVSFWNGTSWRSWKRPIVQYPDTQDTTFMDASYSFMLQRDRRNHLWVGAWPAAIEEVDDFDTPTQWTHHWSMPGWGTADSVSHHQWGWSSAVDSLGYLFVGGDTPTRGVLEPMGIDVYLPDGTWLSNWKAGAGTGLPGNQTRALAIDKYHYLWVGTASLGVSVTTESLTVASLTAPRFTRITDLKTSDIFGVVAHGESLWVLTTSSLKLLGTRNHKVLATYDVPGGPAPRGAVHPLDVGPDGAVWVASAAGVRRYAPGGGRTDYTVDNSPLADNEVRSVSIEPATGVVWFATINGVNRFDPHYVAPVTPPLAALHVKVWPNPAALYGTGFALQLAGEASRYSGEVLDLSGRVLRRFADVGNGGSVWDGRDRDGRLVPPGVYFVRARGGSREATARVVVLR